MCVWILHNTNVHISRPIVSHTFCTFYLPSPYHFSYKACLYKVYGLLGHCRRAISKHNAFSQPLDPSLFIVAHAMIVWAFDQVSSDHNKCWR